LRVFSLRHNGIEVMRVVATPRQLAVLHEQLGEWLREERQADFIKHLEQSWDVPS
jgi:hypothetical protein